MLEREKKRQFLPYFPLPESNSVHTDLSPLVFKLGTAIFDDIESYPFLSFFFAGNENV